MIVTMRVTVFMFFLVFVLVIITAAARIAVFVVAVVLTVMFMAVTVTLGNKLNACLNGVGDLVHLRESIIGYFALDFELHHRKIENRLVNAVHFVNGFFDFCTAVSTAEIFDGVGNCFMLMFMLMTAAIAVFVVVMFAMVFVAVTVTFGNKLNTCLN